MLAFAYRAGDLEEGSGDINKSFKEVQRRAAGILDGLIDSFGALTTDSRRDVPRAALVRFVPQVDGLEFNPSERSFQWIERIHQEIFRFRAPKELDGQVVHGRMEVFLGIVPIAEVGLTIAVNSSLGLVEPELPTTSHGSPYRRIFASYSNKDIQIVLEFELFARAFGDEFVRDWTHLRAGEVWSEELRSVISEADVFQLFWSSDSMESEFVRQEWEYALSLNRPSFIRPVYWEQPMPERPELGLPPESLRRLHFFKISIPSLENTYFYSKASTGFQTRYPPEFEVPSIGQPGYFVVFGISFAVACIAAEVLWLFPLPLWLVLAVACAMVGLGLSLDGLIVLGRLCYRAAATMIQVVRRRSEVNGDRRHGPQ